MRTLFIPLILVLASCSHHQQECFEEAPPSRSELPEDPLATLDQSLLFPVDLSNCSCKEWQRKQYETIGEWQERLQHDLCVRQRKLRVAEKSYQESLEEEQTLAKKLQLRLNQNEELRERTEEQAPVVSTAAINSLPEAISTRTPARFAIHLVQKGETLYSLAIKYYGTADMIPKILQWNQGWLRSPDELVAGSGIVFFSSSYSGSATDEVASYLKQVESSHGR